MKPTKPPAPPSKASWTFLTNHSHVLICLWREPDARLRDVASWVGVTERAVQGIVADLEAAGVITRCREGRRNHYTIHAEVPLRHPVESGRTVASLLGMLVDERAGRVTHRPADGVRRTAAATRRPGRSGGKHLPGRAAGLVAGRHEASAARSNGGAMS